MADTKRIRFRDDSGLTKFWAHLKIWWTKWQLAVATILVIALLSTQAPYVSKWLSAIGISEGWLNSNLVIPFVVLLILWQTVEILRRLDDVEQGTFAIHAFNDIHVILGNAIRDTIKAKEKRLDVLGITLKYTWPDVRRWVDSATLNGWTVNLSAYAPTGRDTVTPNTWATDSETALHDITIFRGTPGRNRKKITIGAFTYTHLPIVHGYKLGNGDIYMAVMPFNADGVKLTAADPPYEVIPGGDRSASAVSKRAMFNSWLKAAQKSTFPRTEPPDATSTTW